MRKNTCTTFATSYWRFSGNPERGYTANNRVYPQFYHDEEITVMDCHERLSGYQYILVSNIEDILLPRQHLTVKDLLKNLSESHPQAGGFYFQVQYHVEEWGNDLEVPDSYFQQYLKSTKPTSQFLKYIYIPSRSQSPPDDRFKNISPFHEQYVEPSLATIHHYGKCPEGLKDCFPETMADKTVTKYQKMLLNNTRTVL
ncbi:hypothetical protein LOTGIDRAFT_169341 [Lottia gigantea]|uniref:Glycosyltransferase family 92 protein n=1 Tax=Lottia gigantea TaxID=225164 RepID=V4B4D5_LOTGI|nr:hypothetical protein LOTGIDRAFT_169341 [Lottia gigantea]ESO83319.1 hypothetical protein LOTGIDRAFT_169341 [Lottia gigantea]